MLKRLSNWVFPLLVSLFSLNACAQVPDKRPDIGNDDFDQKLTSLLRFSAPITGVADLYEVADEVIILDAREKKEYNVSHIPNATWIGYKDFAAERVANLDKTKPIVIYCSVGYRSEKIATKLLDMGFTNVKNLYGSIFEWANQGYPLENEAGNPTNQVHTYNAKWSKWVTDGKAEKIW